VRFSASLLPVSAASEAADVVVAVDVVVALAVLKGADSCVGVARSFAVSEPTPPGNCCLRRSSWINGIIVCA
jgi:hypothetical protein